MCGISTSFEVPRTRLACVAGADASLVARASLWEGVGFVEGCADVIIRASSPSLLIRIKQWACSL
eukprot:554526-Amphidinium_carterae.1